MLKGKIVKTMTTQKKSLELALRVNPRDAQVMMTSPVHIVITDMSHGNHGNSDHGYHNHHVGLSLPQLGAQHWVEVVFIRTLLLYNKIVLK